MGAGGGGGVRLLVSPWRKDASPALPSRSPIHVDFCKQKGNIAFAQRGVASKGKVTNTVVQKHAWLCRWSLFKPISETFGVRNHADGLAFFLPGPKTMRSLKRTLPTEERRL